MIYRCNIHCHSMDINQAESLGIEDKGKWLPFAFDMEVVQAIKMSTDDEDELACGCATVFTDTADAYVTDIPFDQMYTVWEDYKKSKTKI